MGTNCVNTPNNSHPFTLIKIITSLFSENKKDRKWALLTIFYAMAFNVALLYVSVYYSLTMSDAKVTDIITVLFILKVTGVVMAANMVIDGIVYFVKYAIKKPA